jgi:uncharacterized SAM-binding protein YcdF (DUF218 family)
MKLEFLIFMLLILILLLQYKETFMVGGMLKGIVKQKCKGLSPAQQLIIDKALVIVGEKCDI